MYLLADMKLLLVAATEAEIAPLLSHLRNHGEALSVNTFRKAQHEIHLCITGAGMMATAYNLIKKIDRQGFDFAMQAGVAGSFSDALVPGELVIVQSERYGDLGAEDHYSFLDIFDLGLLGTDEVPFTNKELRAPESDLLSKVTLKRVKGMTVNTGSGSAFTIKTRQEQFNCEIESMEGLAFHYVCLKENLAFAQVRSISNFVTPRDRESWKMKDAIINLNEWLINFIENLPA